MPIFQWNPRQNWQGKTHEENKAWFSEGFSINWYLGLGTQQVISADWFNFISCVVCVKTTEVMSCAREVGSPGLQQRLILSHRNQVQLTDFKFFDCLAKAVPSLANSLARIRIANCLSGVMVSTFSCPPSHVYRNRNFFLFPFLH